MQSTFVKSGRFEFTVAGESFEVGPGDAFVIPSAPCTAAAPSGARRPDRHLHPAPDDFPLMLTVETRHAIDPATARGFDTDALRAHFHVGGIFVPGEIPADLHPLRPDDRRRRRARTARRSRLDRVAEAGTPSLLDRREMVVVNIGGDGTVEAAGETHAMVKGDMLYLGMGSGPVTFGGAGRFYILSAPAHATHPTRLIRIAEAATVTLGSAETSNARTIYQFVHPDVMKACQLVVGMTRLEPGSVWNTMPAHVHDRRMEAYLYIDLPETARAIHLMGEPTETRHLVLANEEGAHLAALVDPRRGRHLRLHLHLGDGRRQRRLQGRRDGGDGDAAVSDPFALSTARSRSSPAPTPASARRSRSGSPAPAPR